MGKKWAFIENQTQEVIDIKELARRSCQESPIFENVCVEKGDTLYPIRTGRYSPFTPGVYVPGPGMAVFSEPPKEKKEQYDHEKIIDFGASKSYADFIKKQDKLATEEVARLTTKDEVFEPNIDPLDSPALKALKEALQAKAIDPEMYRPRLGPDFSNSMRLVTSSKNHSITLKKLVTLSKAYDISVDLILKDKEGAINPIGKVIKTNITNTDEGGDGEEDE